MRKEIIKGPGIRVEMDPSEVYPHDPGQGTPVIVVLKNGDTGTWNCVTSEGEADGTLLNQQQLNWILEITPEVEQWMLAHGV